MMYRPLPHYYPPPRLRPWYVRHPFLALCALCAGPLLIILLWKPLLIAAVLAGFGYGLYRVTRSYDQHHLEQVRERQAVEARAEYEHWQLMHGNPRVGVHGQFPPAC